MEELHYEGQEGKTQVEANEKAYAAVVEGKGVMVVETLKTGVYHKLLTELYGDLK